SLLSRCSDHLELPSFPTRRSSDLGRTARLLRLPGRELDPPAHDQPDIESTFATVRHRTKVTKGRGSRTAGLAMAFKLIESAQRRSEEQRLNSSHDQISYAVFCLKK